MGQRILAVDRPGTGLAVSSTRAMPATGAVVATCCKNSLMSSVPLSSGGASKGLAGCGTAVQYSHAQVRRCLRHASRVALGADTPAFAREGDEVVVPAVITPTVVELPTVVVVGHRASMGPGTVQASLKTIAKTAI